MYSSKAKRFKLSVKIYRTVSTPLSNKFYEPYSLSTFSCESV